MNADRKQHLTFENYLRGFQDEFGELRKKFQISDLIHASTEYLKWECSSSTTGVQSLRQKAGVYVFWRNSAEKHESVRVGKHRKDAYNRAMEHIRDRTSSRDGSVVIHQDDKSLQITFILLKDEKDTHWLLAAEEFLENMLQPLIRSRRC